MLVESASFEPYRIGFKQPICIRSAVLSHREGIYVRLRASTGLSALGEVAPLPGLSQESLPEATSQLTTVLPLFSGRSVKSLAQVELLMRDLSFESPLFPSVRCGLEMALLSLLAASQRKTLAEFLNPSPQRTVCVSLLIRSRLEREELMRGISGNQAVPKSVKVKLGDNSFEEDLSFVQRLMTKLPEETLLRLDVNRRWEPDTLNKLCSLVQMDRVEYIEEPFREFDLLASLGTSVRIALDESLYSLHPSQFVFPPSVSALVLKPMVLGGIVATLKWFEAAKKHGRYVVISSSYESPAGLDLLEQLACALQRPGVSSGLGTRDVFR